MAGAVEAWGALDTLAAEVTGRFFRAKTAVVTTAALVAARAKHSTRGASHQQRVEEANHTLANSCAAAARPRISSCCIMVQGVGSCCNHIQPRDV
eukprot:SAG25_NODE_2861_length_1346_cov_1.101844_1_plen_95_part_00